MARASVEVINILKRTALKLERSTGYQWGHMGACNCGFLTQEITNLKKDEIHWLAMQKYGDWSEQLNDYCPTSGLPMDSLISEMITVGFDTDDLKHLEQLSDQRILQTLPMEERSLRHNFKPDVVKYLSAWAVMLEEELLKTITLPDFTSRTSIL
jgi:hypothetical protein